MTTLDSRERMLRTLDLNEADHIPCCFMSFSALRKRCHEDMFELSKAELEMGLDSMLFIPTTPSHLRPEHPHLRGLPVRFHPEVMVREWRQEVEGNADLLHKEYSTPAGTLTTTVKLSEDWPHGEHLPFIDDYQIPRALKPLITGTEDLGALQYLLMPPQEDEIISFREEAKKAHKFVVDHGVLLTGGWGVGLDMAFWLCGMQEFMIAMLKQPGFAKDLLEMIHIWNMSRMQVVLDESINLYIRRAWYEGCDFVTPAFFKEVIVPQLRLESDFAHDHGAKFGYICSSGITPLLESYIESGIDVLIGIDPEQGSHTDMALIKKKIGEKICLWGGVSGAITVEMGTEEEVRSAVRAAINALGPRGFILSPVDNITIDQPFTWNNVEVLIDEWRRAW
ncbi:MAG: hypothetical protein GTO18_06475 [Anaerolineales bacterium]|nr:hypothetical protein [Anaerolineales bacterium]